MINVLLIDDEVMARRTLRNLLSLYCPEVTIVDEADSVLSGINLLKKRAVDAVFLDIRMRDGSGFDLLDHFINPSFKIIFSTAYDQFALRAFQYHAIDYLLKPILPEQLIKSVQKISLGNGDLKTVVQQMALFTKAIKTKELKNITLSTTDGLHILPLDRIIRLESSNNYTTFYTLDGEKVIVARTIKEYEMILPEGLFFRLHRSHIVNVQHIRSVMKEEGGYVLTSDEARLPIARRKKDALIAFIKNGCVQ